MARRRVRLDLWAGSSVMKSAYRFALAGILAAGVPASSSAEPYRYGNCQSHGCNASCPPNYYQWTDHTLACGPLGFRTYCCEPMGFTSQAQKQTSSNAAKVININPRPKYTPRFEVPRSPKVTQGTSWPKYTPKSQFPTSSRASKIPTSATVTKMSPRAGYSSRSQFPKLYGPPLR